MGMNIEAEIEKASAIMARYRVSREDQISIVKTLLDAGVERCLQEQERLTQEKQAMIEYVQRNPIHRRLPN